MDRGLDKTGLFKKGKSSFMSLTFVNLNVELAINPYEEIH